MAWRGAHIGGDNTRLRAGLWAGGSVLTFLVALLIGAIGNHDADQQVNEAKSQIQGLQGQLASIQNGISGLQAIVAPSGGSVDQILFAAISKIEGQQKALDAVTAQLNKLSQESRSPNNVYQNGINIGTDGQSTFDSATNTLTFEVITTNQVVDFTVPLEFRGALFTCTPIRPVIDDAMGAFQALTYHNMTCQLNGPAPPP
jgi:conjugal transfer/entry exclusion protein